MAKYKLPTKAEMERELTMTAQEVERLMDRLDEMKDQLDGYTDDELTTNIGFTAGEKDLIRSLGVGWKNLQLRYENQTPLNADSPVYINRQFLTTLRIF
jgi:hypothetical protein